MTALCVGLVATKASWSQALRAHVRDHGQDIELEVVMDGASLRRVLQRLDVLVIDDVMRTFSFADIARARDADVHVIGLCDAAEGMGRQYLLALGAEEVTSAAAPPAELVSRLAELRPRQSGDSAARPLLPPLRAVGLQRRRPRGQLTAWTKVSGGAGLTELVVGAAEELSGHANALLVEAEEISAVLLSRLCRAPEAGLAWALARARQGLPAVKDALSGLRNDGAPPVGHFDVLCAPAGPSQVISGSLLDKVLEEATGAYDHVLVETGWLVALTSARERFSSTTVVLQRAGTVVVVASADPEGAAQLVHWKALALAAEVTAPCWAVFGRAPSSRYERDHLVALVDANTGRHPFAGFAFLPEDPAVRRARWNAQVPSHGPWSRAVQDLVRHVVPAPEPSARGLSAPRKAGSRRRPRPLVAAS